MSYNRYDLALFVTNHVDVIHNVSFICLTNKVTNVNGVAKKINKKKTVQAIQQAEPQAQVNAVANIIVKKGRGAKRIQSDTAITC
jgi:hypothetical protein